MADRKLFIDLFARDKTKQGTDSAARNLDDVGEAAEDAAKSTDKLGKAAKENADRVGKLDREAKLLERELHSLARAFADTDDAAQRMDLSKAIRKMEADLKRVSKQKGVLEKLLPDPGPAAKSFIAKLGGSLAGSATRIATSAGGAVGPVVGGAIAAAAAPVLVSALGSALAGGAGLGVIGVGIMAAVKKSPEIQAAGKAAGTKFTAGLAEVATQNLRGPILQSLGILTDAGDRLNKELGSTFRELADDVVPFTRKVVGAGEAVTGSLLKAARESGPALDGLGDSVTLLGDGVAFFVDALADGGPEAADNLRLIAGATGDLLKMSGTTLAALNDLANSPWVSGALLPLLRKHYADAADASDDLKGSTQALIPPMTEAEKAARGQTAAMAGLSKEMHAQADPVFALRESQLALAKAQKASTEAIKKHGAGSKEAKAATRELATAAIDLQGRVGALGASFDGKLTPAMRSTLIAAGLTEGQIREVEGEFGAAKKAGDRYAKTYAATTKVYGAATARKSLFSVADAANDIPRAVTISMKITGVSNVSKAAASIRKNYEARADGGPVKAGKAYVVGDGGVPEVFVPDRDGTIIPSIDQYTSARGAAGMPARAMTVSGGGAQQMILSVAPGGDAALQALLRALLPYLRTEVRTSGAGSVQRLLGVKGVS